MPEGGTEMRVVNKTFFYDSSDADLVEYIEGLPERTYTKLLYIRGYYNGAIYTASPLIFNLTVSCNFERSIVQEPDWFNPRYQGPVLTVFHRR